MKRNELFVQGAYYHVWNRRANREPIFFNTGNYIHLLRLFKKYRTRYQIAIIAYCLMPNHYHILLRQDGDVPLSKFMQTVFNAYHLLSTTWIPKEPRIFVGISTSIL